MFAKPDIGSIVSVAIKRRDYYAYRTSDWLITTYEGKVLRSESYDPPNSFRMTGVAHHPIRLIHLVDVNNIIVNGSIGEQAEPNRTQTIVVQGSKDNEYVITLTGDGKASCTCPAFLYRKMVCKHIQSLKGTNNIKEVLTA